MAYDRYGSDFPHEETSRDDAWHRMGMHDFTERYGRYSGGDPYGYEYSERSVEHRHPRYREGTGFSRELPAHRDRRRSPRGAPWARRLHERRARRYGFHRYGREYGRREHGVRESGRPPRPRRPGRGERWYEPRDPW